MNVIIGFVIYCIVIWAILRFIDVGTRDDYDNWENMEG